MEEITMPKYEANETKNLSEFKREIVITFPEYPQYRVLCRFGFDSFITEHWWGHLQKKVVIKKFLFFGEEITTWKKISQCWWVYHPDSIDSLAYKSFKLLDECILEPKRNLLKAMSI
jgi:hypothetical protein